MKTLCTTHKIKLYARRANHTKLETALNTHRVLYNSALTQRRIAFKSHGKSINYNYQSAELTDLRKHDPYWQAQHRNLAIGTLRRLDRSFQNMFRRIKRGEKAGYPRYIKYGQFRTLSVNENNVTRTMLKYKDDDHKRGYIKVKGVGTFGSSITEHCPILISWHPYTSPKLRVEYRHAWCLQLTMFPA